MIEEKLLAAYVSELEALRTYGSELARAYPDVAARLDIGPRQSRDGHVERVVESAAFLAARLRMMIEASAAELPMTLLSVLAPTLLEPVPSMAIGEFRGGSEAHNVPQGARLDCHVSDQSLLCFRTTMAVSLAPVRLTTRRLNPREGHADGIAIEVSGTSPSGMKLFLGSDELSAAALADGLSRDLKAIELVPPGAREPTRLSPSRLALHGLSPDEAALPLRPATLHAHRLVTEFMCFPEKFRFASIADTPLRHGSEIRLWFSKPLRMGSMDQRTLVSANRVPLINLWPAAATPFEVNGRQLEYPVRVDALRYRILECHSVESVDMYGPGGGDGHPARSVERRRKPRRELHPVGHPPLHLQGRGGGNALLSRARLPVAREASVPRRSQGPGKQRTPGAGGAGGERPHAGRESRRLALCARRRTNPISTRARGVASDADASRILAEQPRRHRRR